MNHHISASERNSLRMLRSNLLTFWTDFNHSFVKPTPRFCWRHCFCSCPWNSGPKAQQTQKTKSIRYEKMRLSSLYPRKSQSPHEWNVSTEISASCHHENHITYKLFVTVQHCIKEMCTWKLDCSFMPCEIICCLSSPVLTLTYFAGGGYL